MLSLQIDEANTARGRPWKFSGPAGGGWVRFGVWARLRERDTRGAMASGSKKSKETRAAPACSRPHGHWVGSWVLQGKQACTRNGVTATHRHTHGF